MKNSLHVSCSPLPLMSNVLFYILLARKGKEKPFIFIQLKKKIISRFVRRVKSKNGARKLLYVSHIYLESSYKQKRRCDDGKAVCGNVISTNTQYRGKCDETACCC